jgi:hypothetical protein
LVPPWDQYRTAPPVARPALGPWELGGGTTAACAEQHDIDTRFVPHESVGALKRRWGWKQRQGLRNRGQVLELLIEKGRTAAQQQ